MENLELKARCADLEAARERAERLGARLSATLDQRDTFFTAGLARLKLREEGDEGAQLVAYRRPDETAARLSRYQIYRTRDAAGLGSVLARALGACGRVEKRRRVYLWCHTRIHLDEVRGLGCFVELETVLNGQTEEAARAELEAAMSALAIRSEDLVAEAYVDLAAATTG